MGQTVLPIQYEVEDKPEGMTGLAGLPLYLEFAHVIGLRRLIADHLQARQGGQGWTDDRILLALVLLNLAGGENVEDVRVLEGDDGFCRLHREIEFFGRTGSERRALKRRWRKERNRTFPSVTAIREYFECFHNPGQEQYRKPHVAFIPEQSQLPGALVLLIGAFAAAIQRRSPEKTATLDMDATLVETFKKTALYCYSDAP